MTSSSDKLQSLQELQQALVSKQVHKWAKARFTYACSLLQRSQQYHKRIQQQLSQKAYEVLLELWQQKLQRSVMLGKPIKYYQSTQGLRKLRQHLNPSTHCYAWEVQLQSQETELFDTFLPHNNQCLPLQANYYLQQQQAQQHLDEFMACLDAAMPTEPGPLNPEKILIRLLKEANTLSPAYMRRLLNTVETLLWLEKVA